MNLVMKQSSDINPEPGRDKTPAEREGDQMFKKFIEQIIKAEDQDDAWQKVFYGINGIDMAYQEGRITLKEYDLLTSLIEKLA